MKLRDILKKAAGFSDSPFGEVIKQLVPGAGIAGKLIESISDSVGVDVIDMPVASVSEKIKRLPADNQAELLDREIDLKIVESNNYAELSATQEMNNASTRPQIAMKMANLFVEFAKSSFHLAVLAIVVDFWLLMTDHAAFALALTMDGLPWLAGAYAVPAMEVIRQYFARRSDDKRTAAAASGATMPPAVGFMDSMTSLVRGKK
jgi:hypothetical protein